MAAYAPSFSGPTPRWVTAARVIGVVALEVLIAAALAIGAFALIVAVSRPALVFVPAVVSLTFIPAYVAPSFGPLLLEPTACLLWVVAAALILRGMARTDRIELNVVDWAVLAFFALMAL